MTSIAERFIIKVWKEVNTHMSSLLQDQMASGVNEPFVLTLIRERLEIIEVLGIVQCSVNSPDDLDSWTEIDPKQIGSLLLEASHRSDSVVIAHTKSETPVNDIELFFLRLEKLIENVGLYVKRISMSHDFSSNRVHFLVKKSKFSTREMLLVVLRKGTFLSFAFFPR